MRHMKWLQLALLFVLLSASSLWAQDSTIVVPPGEGEVPNVLSVLELLSWGASLAGAFFFKQWNVAQGKLDGINNFVKAIAATVLVALIGLIARYVGAEVTGTGFDLTQVGITNLLVGIGSTVLVYLGISTAKEKAVAVKRAA